MDEYIYKTIMAALAVVLAVIGWFVKSLLFDVKENTKEIQNIKLDYLQKTEFKEYRREVLDKLDSFDRKLDSILKYQSKHEE